MEKNKVLTILFVSSFILGLIFQLVSINMEITNNSGYESYRYIGNIFWFMFLIIWYRLAAFLLLSCINAFKHKENIYARGILFSVMGILTPILLAGVFLDTFNITINVFTMIISSLITYVLISGLIFLLEHKDIKGFLN